MRDIKDYFYFYLGADPDIIIQFTQGEKVTNMSLGNIEGLETLPNAEYEIKLFLRPLVSMTVEELREFGGGSTFAEHYAEEIISSFKTVFSFHSFISKYGDNDSINWLLKRGFDIFQLIEENLAIPKTI